MFCRFRASQPNSNAKLGLRTRPAPHHVTHGLSHAVRTTCFESPKLFKLGTSPFRVKRLAEITALNDTKEFTQGKATDIADSFSCIEGITDFST